jgi:hypothetical protein
MTFPDGVACFIRAKLMGLVTGHQVTKPGNSIKIIQLSLQLQVMLLNAMGDLYQRFEMYHCAPLRLSVSRIYRCLSAGFDEYRDDGLIGISHKNYIKLCNLQKMTIIFDCFLEIYVKLMLNRDNLAWNSCRDIYSVIPATVPHSDRRNGLM